MFCITPDQWSAVLTHLQNTHHWEVLLALGILAPWCALILSVLFQIRDCLTDLVRTLDMMRSERDGPLIWDPKPFLVKLKRRGRT